jgi:transposase
LRNLFDRAGDPRKVLCAPIDYAKRKHTVLFCNGVGDILKKAFAVDNSPSGLTDLLAHLNATCRHHSLLPTHAFFGGEDIPAWAENFITALRARGFPVARVNAWEAKKQRENFQASSDTLDLLGIAQCLLKHRGSFNPPVADDYRQLRDLCRERHCFVTSATALTNRLHNYVDRLFPQFLDPKKSGIPPFTSACWWLLQERFSAPEIAQRRTSNLTQGLRRRGLPDPATTAAKLQALAREVLPPCPRYVATWQQLLKVLADEGQSLQQIIAGLDQQIAPLLAKTPGAVLTSISGIGVTLAAGMAGELGPPDQLPKLDWLCSYAGIVPATKQSGGPDQAPVVLGVRHRANHHLKDYLVQAANKMGQLGPPELRQRYHDVQARHSHADFVLAKDLLGLAKSLMHRQALYLPPDLYAPQSSASARATYYLELWPKLLIKWQSKAPLAQVFAAENPLGKWREMAQQSYSLSLPLPKRSPSAKAQDKASIRVRRRRG